MVIIVVHTCKPTAGKAEVGGELQVKLHTNFLVSPILKKREREERRRKKGREWERERN